MTVYVLAQLNIHDATRYQRYVDAFMPVLAKFSGRLLVADDRVELVEGDVLYDKAVLMTFPDEVAFRTWSVSPEYKRIAEDRIASSTAHIVLMQSIV